MEKVIKKRLNIQDMLVKRLGEETGKKVHDQILYGKNKKNNAEVPVKNK